MAAPRLASGKPPTPTAPPWYRRKPTAEALARYAAFTVILAGSVLLLIPLVWMISSSLQSDVQVSTFPPSWVPRPITWRNYWDALTVVPYARYFVNSATIAVLAVVGAVFSSSFVGFAFARLRAPERNALFMVLLATMMLPGQVTMIPVYVIYRWLGWINTFLPLIVPSFFGSAFYIFLMRQFFLTIPPELEDAAKIDGASFLRMYWSIFLPNARPALATVAIFSFTSHWNDFLGPLIYLNDPEKYTITLGLNAFRASQYSAGHMNWLMAVSLLAVLPVLGLFLAAQRTFIRGIVTTGLKG